MNLPNGFEKWNPAMRGAYLKGRKACENGMSIDDCPYKDKRKPSGGLSWSRAFIRAWEDGFRDEVSEKMKLHESPTQGHGNGTTKGNA